LTDGAAHSRDQQQNEELQERHTFSPRIEPRHARGNSKGHAMKGSLSIQCLRPARLPAVNLFTAIEQKLS
jgi:hypothetical protein